MKTIPTTTAQACAKYKTRRYKCECPDFTQRGGSYFHARAGRHVCKHICAILSGDIDQDEILAIEQAITVSQVQANRAKRWASLSVPTKQPKTRIDYLELEPTAEELFARFA